MNCPFLEDLKSGKIVCDSGYDRSHNSKQCPTKIFNQCQEDAYQEQLRYEKLEILKDAGLTEL